LRGGNESKIGHQAQAEGQVGRDFIHKIEVGVQCHYDNLAQKELAAQSQSMKLLAFPWSGKI
jgi:hypothetical protein